jgi:hypothetical protein
MKLSLDGLVQYAVIRQNIYENKKAGIMPAPYIKKGSIPDNFYIIFSKNSFPPVYKAQDCFSLFIKKYINYGSYLDKTLGALAIVRIIAFMDVLVRMGANNGNINFFRHWAVDFDEWKHNINLLVGKLPMSLKKDTESAIENLSLFLKVAVDLQKHIQNDRSFNIQKVTQFLTKYRGFTPLVAYAIAADLYKNKVLEHANDFETWCNIGPTAGKAIQEIILNSRDFCSNDVKSVFERLDTYSITEQRILVQKAMQQICLSMNNSYWPTVWPRLTLHDVERIVVQYHKFVDINNRIF